MQSFALNAADKQLIKTFFITFIAVVAGLPVASAIMPGRQDALAHTVSGSGVAKTAEDLGLGACGTGTGAAKSASTKSTHEHEVVTRHTNVNTSSNNGGATAQVGRDGIAASVNALNDVVDVNDVLDLTVGNVSVPILSNNSTPILSGTNSGNGSGGLLGLGLLGL